VLGQRGQALQFAFGLALRGLGQVRLLDLRAHLLGLADARVALADLDLDLAHATAQQSLASLGIHLLGPRLVAQRPLRLGDGDLALEVPRDPLQAPGRIGLLEQGDLLLRRKRQRRGDHVGHQAGTRDARDEGLPLVRVVVVEIDHRLRQGDDALPHCLELRRVALDVGHRVESHQQGGVFLDRRRSEPGSGHAHDDGLLSVAPGVDDAYHPDHAAHGEEVVDGRFLGGGVALGGDDQEPALSGPLQGRKGVGAPDGQGDGDPGEHHDVAHRKHREHRRDVDRLPLAGGHHDLCLDLFVLG
jgi:hypothetical protein